MGNIIQGIKNVLLNRNTVTILAVIAGVIALWFFYDITLSNAIDPQRVPVATRTITAKEMITAEDFEFVEINSEFLNNANVITNSNQLVGYYVKNETSITEGAMFYREQVVEKSELKEREQEDLPNGYTLYWLQVDNNSTYANSIYPGDKIDLWLKAEITNSIVYDEFINSIEVLSVKDSTGQNVFDANNAGREPEWLAFAVTTEMFEYLELIERISGMQLFPVPRNELYTTEGAEVSYSNEALKGLIESYAGFTPGTTSTATSDQNTSNPTE